MNFPHARQRAGARCIGAFSPDSLLQEIQAISTNFRHNEQIRISPVRLVNDKEEQVGIVSTAEALRMAREAGLDLVEVAPNARPPVCRIMDYGKWRYQQQKKEDKSRASSRAGRLKQINIDTIRIGDHDLEIKINRARDFLKEGNKVQFTLRFKGREMAHLDLGRNLMNKVKQELFLVSKVERDAKMEGRRMTLVLQPDHKDPNKLKPSEQLAANRAGSPLDYSTAATDRLRCRAGQRARGWSRRFRARHPRRVQRPQRPGPWLRLPSRLPRHAPCRRLQSLSAHRVSLRLVGTAAQHEDVKFDAAIRRRHVSRFQVSRASGHAAQT